MTSSTSTSDAAPPGTRRARRWGIVAAATFFGGTILLYALIILVDPYDTARFPRLPIAGLSDNNVRTSHASRARDPRFDSAIFGSSTGQAIDPYRLSDATGLRFTQLTFSHAAPREELAVLDWFLAHHTTRPGAVVIIADDTWCSPDPNQPPRYPFPHWLYGSDARYLASVLNWKSFDRIVWRVLLALGKRQPNDQVGFFGAYEQPTYVVSPTIPPEMTRAEAEAPFPWIALLARSLQRLPRGGAAIIVMPPVFHDYLAPPGSHRATWLARCKSALAGAAASTPPGAFLDQRLDTPDNRIEANFSDRIHYRPALARTIEDRIAAALRNTPTPVAARTHDPIRQ